MAPSQGGGGEGNSRMGLVFQWSPRGGEVNRETMKSRLLSCQVWEKIYSSPETKIFVT